MRVRLTVLVALLFSSLVGLAHANTVNFAAGEEFTEPQATDFTRSAAAYWTDHRDLATYTPALWRLLRRQHASLTVHLRYGRDFGPIPAGRRAHADMWPILRDAARYKVPVTAWLVVPYDDGYWAHERNAALQAKAVDAYFAWAKRKKVRADALLLDLEASVQDTKIVSHLTSDPIAVEEMLRRNADPAQQCAAGRQYAALVRSIRARGLRPVASATPFVLDDLVNGDLALSDGLNLPLVVPGQYDDVGFMAMRTVLKQMTGIDPGGSIVASYQQSISRWFGREGSLVLGVAGTPPYDDLGVFAADVRTAATGSRAPVGVYSLELVFKSFGLAGVRSVLEAARTPLTGDAAKAAMTVAPAASAERAILSAMDVLVGLGTPFAGVSRNESPRLANGWPVACVKP